MSARLDPASVARDFLLNVGTSLDDFPDPYDCSSSDAGQTNAILPARLRGKLGRLQGTEQAIANRATQARAAAQQEWSGRGLLNCTGLDSAWRELDLAKDRQQSEARENWFCGLSAGEQAAFDAYSLALGQPVISALIPPETPTCLHGALARLALQVAGITRAYEARRTERQRSMRSRGLGNPTVIQGAVDRLLKDEQQAKSLLVSRWLRELTAEQEAACASADAGQAEGATVQAAESAVQPGQALATPDDPARDLTDLQFDILDAMRALHSTDPARKRTADDIAARIGGNATAQACKAPLSDLKRRGLADSKTGRRGGSWLTAAGIALINRVRAPRH